MTTTRIAFAALVVLCATVSRAGMTRISSDVDRPAAGAEHDSPDH